MGRARYSHDDDKDNAEGDGDVWTDIDHDKDYDRNHKTVNLGYAGKWLNAKYTYKIFFQGVSPHTKRRRNLKIHLSRIEAR
jgi:hypothetical protein